MRFAFAGFRHFHVLEMYKLVTERRDCRLVAAAEDDPQAAIAAREQGVELTHDSLDALFAVAETFDAVVVADYYSRRGAVALRALRAGKHVISDKPPCTTLPELDQIVAEATTRGLQVGCMLGNRFSSPLRTLKKYLHKIAPVETVTFMGQHPLLYGSRAGFYFEDGKHGGTLNDIAIHAADVLPWLLGTKWVEVVAARIWNRRLPQHPRFNVCGQVMLRMEDGTGVLGDVSYLSPDSQGYTVPQYWRFTLHGHKGILETSITQGAVKLWADGADTEEALPLEPDDPGGYLTAFLNAVARKPAVLTSAEVFHATRTALLAQVAADTGETHVTIP